MQPCLVRELSVAELLPAATHLLTDLGPESKAHGRMQMAYARETTEGELEVLYVLSQGACEPYMVWRVRPEQSSLPSLAQMIPLLGWYEREMQDLYGLTFTDSPDIRALVLHEGAAPALPPMLRDYPAQIHMPFRSLPPELPKVIGPEIQRLPFGPVRADVLESAQFLFFYIGEGILHYEPRLFYKHRGMEKRFQGLSPKQGVVIAERVSGVDSVAHALAFCQACEAALGWRPPARARALRVILAELERIYNHLHYFAYLAKTTTLKVASAEGMLLEERVKQMNARLTGSRFLRSVITVGGLRRDLDLSCVDAELSDLEREIEAYLQRMEATRSHLDRLITTGILERQVAFDQGACGPVERASGLDRDLRRDHPYAAYDRLRFDIQVATAGDAHARAQVRAGEIGEALACIHQAIAHLKPGPVWRGAVMEASDPAGEGLGWVEGTRGGLFYAVQLADGMLTRVKIKEPSFSNWRVFPFTVQDSNMMDYAINEASFGLAIAGVDR